jgi:type I restriction enzyme S subunit
MLKEKMLVPQLRFSEFEEQWIMEEFRKIANKRKKRFNPKESDKNFPCIELECLSQETGILLKKFDSKYQKSIKNIFSKEDILFGKLRPYLRKFLKPDFDGVCSSEIWVLNGKKVINDYLYFLIQTDRFNYQVNQTSGSKMPRADWDYISQIKFNYPQSKEQQKIANFLTAIDNRIHTLEKKKTLLEQYKKGVMQKIFKQELRFKDDTSTSLSASDGKAFPEWEEKKLGDFLSLPKKETPEFIDIAKILTVKLNLKGVFLNNRTDGLKIGATKYIIRKKGQFIYGKQNLFNGAFAIIPDKFDGFVSSGDVPSLDIDSNQLDSKFLYFFLARTSFYKKLENIASGSGSKRIHEKTLFKVEIGLPSLKEQTKIANFLSTVDKNIALVSKKIEHTKTYKKGLMQQMFV